MTVDRRVSDWLESGVAAVSGFIPPGDAATRARVWSAELKRLTAAWGRPVAVDGAALLAERAAFTGARSRGTVSAGGACRMQRCADGWVAVSLPRTADVELVPALIEGAVEDPWVAVREWAATRTATEILERSRLLGLAVSRVGRAGMTSRSLAQTSALPSSRAPLVIDFSALWAGPLCASLLGLAGARVIKVESTGRLDGARRGDPHFYDLVQAGHESVCVDPHSPSDREALGRLVAAADVVIEASRPRALAGWGLSASDAASRGTVWVSITAYGRAAGDRIGFGDDVAAGAGLVGWAAGTPVFAGDAIADPLTGLFAAVATLQALAAGRGALLDVSMSAIVAGTLDGMGEEGTGLTVTSADPGSPPRRRPISGTAALPGADTARVLAEFAR